MSDPTRVSVQRRIASPAAEIFAVVTDPAMHVEIDGSAMLQAAPDAKPLRQVGDTFDINMDREPLGDLPMGKYQVRNHVTRIEPDSLLEWAVGGKDRPPLGHVYGYSLEPNDDGTTLVTNYCDWSGISERLRSRVSWPIVPVEMLEKSLENLEKIMIARQKPAG